MVRIPLLPLPGELRSLKLCGAAKKKKDVWNLAEASRYRSMKFKSGIVHVQGSVRGSKTQKKDIYGSRKSIL